MKKQKKQNLLTMIIIILVMVLALLVGSIIYEEKINMDKQQNTEITLSPEIEEEENDIIEEIPLEDENEEQVEDKEEYVGEEEQKVENSTVKEDTTKSNDEKAIDLAKKEWGKDESVRFSIDEKQGNKYYVAVKSEATVLQWYEINIETWEINEYY